jgi:hypothetical protein
VDSKILMLGLWMKEIIFIGSYLMEIKLLDMPMCKYGQNIGQLYVS